MLAQLPPGLEPTLPPLPAPPRRRLAAGTGPQPAPSLLDATMPRAAGGAEAPVIVRAGARADYPALAPVDPRHYVIGAELARGGMGRVTTARDRRLGRAVAIKELLASSPAARARFEREARLTARLAHPSIVGVLEAGVWPDGEPFYAMEHVAGVPLAEALARCATLAERLALVPTVIAAADALGYAHARGVIHRDLKPGNVMVGEFGETVVIDWGLAKQLGEADTTSAAPASSVDATCAGTVLGTPAYMPAEQARGEAVDARADVYALGAMLYQVLAGAPPYAAASAQAQLAAVLAGPPPRLASRAPGVAPELCSIVERAMAHDPGGRYPTARELARDLRTYQTGQLVGSHRYTRRQLLARWLRRHRTAALVATVALVVLATVGGASLRRIVRAEGVARAERSVAVAHRADAEELMDFMLGDLRTRLEPVGKLELLDAVARRAQAYYATRTDAADAPTRARHALARRNLGDVLLARGDTAAARVEFEAAVAGQAALATDDATHVELVRTQQRLGGVRLRDGDLDGAEAAYRAAAAITARFAGAAPGDVRWRRALALADVDLGNVARARGDDAAALAAFRAAAARAAATVAAAPDDRAARHDVARAHAELGDLLLQDLGDTAGALAANQVALRHRTDLAEADPADAGARRDLALSHGKVGDAHLRLGDTTAALDAYRRALALVRELTATDPSHTGWQRDLAIAHANLGDGLAARGDVDGALAAHRAAGAIFARLVRIDPASVAWQRDLAVNHLNLGDLLRGRGDLVDALAAYRAAQAIRARLVASDPGHVGWRRDLAVAHDRVGDVHQRRGDLAGARAAYGASLTIRAALAEAEPANPLRRRQLAVSHDQVGDVLQLERDLRGALAAYRAALTLREGLVALDADRSEWVRDLGVSHDKLGDVLRALGDRAAARAAYQAGVDASQRLAALEPANPAWQAELVDASRKLARLR